ncbi:MAG TPA: hypothetical protein PKJ34_13145 [Anaerolineaceae bacterium]|nr:hypothetical protein [Anaerolineaceae bacterium]
MDIPKCPYCSQSLEKKPTRKYTCPHCNNIILVRMGVMYTEEGAEIFDWLKRLSFMEVSIDEFNSTRKELTRQLSCEVQVQDVIWKILTNRFQIDNLSMQKFCLLEMERFARMEGRSTKPYTAARFALMLRDYMESGYRIVEIKTNDLGGAHEPCKKCTELNGKRLPILVAMEEMPIPNDCENDWCYCSYEAVTESHIHWI